MNEREDIDLAIRTAELTDAGMLAKLMTELGYETRESEMAMRLEAIAADSHYQTLVAVSAGKICGMIGTFCYYGYEHNSLGGRIIALVVSTGSRGRGVGKKLVAAAEADFAQRNISRVAVNTRLERKEAQKFYENIGYVRNGFRFVKTLPSVAD
jgi:ribosomal protein S18 acetylase RimI-like enzyme